MSGVLGILFGSGVFWFTALLLTLICILPDLVIRAYRDMTNPVYISISNSRTKQRTTNHVSEPDCWNPIGQNRVAVSNDVELERLEPVLGIS